MKILKALSSARTACLASLILGFAASPSFADTFDQVNRGWVESTGRRMVDSRNTYTGSLPPELHYNSFFVFDLSELDGPVESATLWLELEGYWGPDLFESFTVFDVVTDPVELGQDQADRTDIFEDLQTGAVYGTAEASPADVGQVIEIQLSSEAIADVNAAAGGLFAVGLHLDDIGGLTSEEGLRWSLKGEERTHQLELELGPSFAVELDPEMALSPVDGSHTVMAQVRDFRGDALPDALVSFDILEGPNAGMSDSVTTDALGEAHFSYLGAGEDPGVDSVVASFDSGGDLFESDVAVSFRDADCNENDVADTCDLSCEGFDGMCAESYAECGTSLDADSDGAPDECYQDSEAEVDPEPALDCSDPRVKWRHRHECAEAERAKFEEQIAWLLERILRRQAPEPGHHSYLRDAHRDDRFHCRGRRCDARRHDHDRSRDRWSWGWRSRHDN